ncbi:MAG: CxxC-x17-CxxC domain-containing protein [Minisyncoccia bacterium]|jgi:CxxC-x17-CxxC domain-containing protein
MNKFRKPHGNGGPREGGRFSDRGPIRPGFGKPSFGGPARPRFGGPRKEGIELFDAVCSKCGKACQVPFRPNGQKPVYCRACFGSPANAPAGRENFVRRDAPVASFEPRNDNRELADLKQQLGAVNSKIDSILKTLGSIQGSIAHQAIHDAVVAAVSSKTDSPKVTEKELPKKKVAKKKGAAKK